MKKIFLSFLSLIAVSFAGEINIYAASDLVFAFKELKKVYKEKYPQDRIRVIFGSSGKGYSQIVNSAPFDIIFSANELYVKKLEEKGLTISPIKLYAYGKIVLWTRKDSGIDVKKGINVLLDKKVKKISIANWKHAPYGVAAKECLEYYNLFEKVRDKLIIGENIAQTAQYAESGAADVGIIALSLALSDRLKREGIYYLLSEKCYSPIRQAYAILKHAKEDKERFDTAMRFFNFISSKEAKKILKKYGFSLPENQ